jgi:hypothetical protein
VLFSAGLQRRYATTGHYARLGIKKDATVLDIKKAFITKVKTAHPDLKQEEEDKEAAVEEFRLLRAAYECLYDETSRRAYDGNQSVDSSFHNRERRKTNMRRGGAGASRMTVDEETRARERRMAREYGTTVAEVEVRKLIHAKKMGEAIRSWASLGSPLALCEFMLEQCRLTRQFPEDSDLKALLDALHDSEAPPASNASTDKGEAPIADNQLSVFVLQKTAVYNTLICVANSISTLTSVFKIIDEMENRGIEKDTATVEGIMWAIHTKEPHEDVNNLYYSGGTSY